MNYEFQKLENGARVFYVPLKDTKSVTTMVMYPVGSRYESEKMSGVSHFIEHLMFKGTKKRKNSFILTREIDRLGAEYNAFTSKEYTGYYIKSGTEYAKKSLDILSDMLFDSLFDAKEMEKEKSVIVEEIKMYNDNPLMNIENVFEEVFFEGPLGRDIAGTEKTVLSLKRDAVLTYRDKHYQPKNIIIIIAGNFPGNIGELVKEYFGRENSSETTSQKFKPSEINSSKKSDRIKARVQKTDQAQLMLGFPGFAYSDPNNYALNVLNMILGGSMSSRLFMQIREKLGLAYMVRSGEENFRDSGYSFIRMGLDAKNINKAVAVVKKELEKMISKGATDRELKDAKTRTRGIMDLTMEDSSNLASWYAKEALFEKQISNPEEWLKMIEEVSNSDIKKTAGKIFKMNQMIVGIIGNINKDNIIF